MEVSHEMLVLMLACVCGVEFLAVLWMRSNYGESCNALRLRMCQSLKIGGSLARNARFDACMSVVLSFWLCSGCAVTMGEAAETCLFRGVTRSRGFPLASQ